MNLLENSHIEFEQKQINNLIQSQDLFKQTILNIMSKTISVDISKHKEYYDFQLRIYNSLSKIFENLCLLLNLKNTLQEMTLNNDFSKLEEFSTNQENYTNTINQNNIYISNTILLFFNYIDLKIYTTPVDNKIHEAGNIENNNIQPEHVNVINEIEKNKNYKLEEHVLIISEITRKCNITIYNIRIKIFSRF